MASMLRSLLSWLAGLFFYGREMELTLVGLQNAGKTSLVNVLTGHAFSSDVVPTIGFNSRQLVKGRVTIRIWDLSGQPRFRSMWERYCYRVNAILFVVDSADESTFKTARAELHALLDKPHLHDIPLLVLGNKCDKPTSLRARDLVQALGLDQVTDREISCYSISTKDNVNLDITLQWLLDRR